MLESSKTEVVNTTTSENQTTQRERVAPTVETAQGAGTLTRTATKSETEKSSSESTPVSKTEQPVTGGGSEPTPNELVNLGRPPYITDLLEARMAYETFDVKQQLSEIDSFIREGLEDDRVAYENAVKGILAQIGEQDSVYTRISRIAEYVKLQQKIQGIIKEKEEFEAKSPEEMSADELKRLFKSKGM
jgi:hypothetical protein